MCLEDKSSLVTLMECRKRMFQMARPVALCECTNFSKLPQILKTFIIEMNVVKIKDFGSFIDLEEWPFNNVIAP